MIGNGTTYSNGLVLSSGVLNASDQARAAHEEFSLIIQDAALFASAGDQSVTFPIYAILGANASACSDRVPQ